VARRIADEIGLRLDDAPGEPVAIDLMDERLADQVARQRDRIAGELVAA
jgi:hypothetical protein